MANGWSIRFSVLSRIKIKTELFTWFGCTSFWKSNKIKIYKLVFWNPMGKPNDTLVTVLLWITLYFANGTSSHLCISGFFFFGNLMRWYMLCSSMAIIVSQYFQELESSLAFISALRISSFWFQQIIVSYSVVGNDIFQFVFSSTRFVPIIE